jgi:hypothetical protein
MPSAYVFITGRRDPELAAAVKEIGGNVPGVQGGVASLGDLDRLLRRTTTGGDEATMRKVKLSGTSNAAENIAS